MAGEKTSELSILLAELRRDLLRDIDTRSDEELDPNELYRRYQKVVIPIVKNPKKGEIPF